MTDPRIIQPPLLRFGDGRRTTDPLRGLAELNCPPMEPPKTDSIIVIPFLPEDCGTCKQLPALLESLVNGIKGTKYPRCAFDGFVKHFGVSIKVEEPIPYSNSSDAKSKIDQLVNESDVGSLLLAISIPQETYGCGDYQQLKIRCIERNVSSQIVTGTALKTYASNTPDDKGTFLWNVALGIFTKMGGIPWMLDSPVEDVSAFIGIATIASAREGVMTRSGATALQITNKWGRPVSTLFSSHEQAVRKKGIFKDINPAKFDELIRSATVDIKEHVLSPEKSSTEDFVVFHLGDRYSQEIYDAMAKALEDEGIPNYKMIHVRKRSTHMQFDSSKKKASQAWPKAGEWGYLIPDRKAFLYTAGSWKYYSSALPYVIDASDVAPIEVKLLRSSVKSGLDKMDLEDIYCLTRLKYDSVDIPRIRLPITLTLSRRASQLVSCGLTRDVFSARFLY